MDNDIKNQLFAELERDYPRLAGIGPDRAYEALSRICRTEGRPITVEQMLRYAVVLEDDLEHDELV